MHHIKSSFCESEHHVKAIVIFLAILVLLAAFNAVGWQKKVLKSSLLHFTG